MDYLPLQQSVQPPAQQSLHLSGQHVLQQVLLAESWAFWAMAPMARTVTTERTARIRFISNLLLNGCLAVKSWPPGHRSPLAASRNRTSEMSKFGKLSRACKEGENPPERD